MIKRITWIYLKRGLFSIIDHVTFLHEPDRCKDMGISMSKHTFVYDVLQCHNSFVFKIDQIHFDNWVNPLKEVTNIL